MTTETVRKCNLCGQYKLLSCFHRDSHSRGGFKTYCKSCYKRPARAPKQPTEGRDLHEVMHAIVACRSVGDEEGML